MWSSSTSSRHKGSAEEGQAGSFSGRHCGARCVVEVGEDAGAGGAGWRVVRPMEAQEAKFAMFSELNGKAEGGERKAGASRGWIFHMDSG